MTTPDPKTVREIARKFLLDPHMTASDLKACIRDHIGTEAPDEVFSAWHDAVKADARKGVVETVASWPDEQQPADVVTAGPPVRPWTPGEELPSGPMDDAEYAAFEAAIRSCREDPEVEADVRAVAEACADFGNDEGPRGIRQLYARFTDRIAALDATETEES